MNANGSGQSQVTSGPDWDFGHLSGSGKAAKAPAGAVASKKKRFKLRPKTVEIAPGTPATVSLKVSKKGRKALERALEAGKTGKVKVTATFTDDLGQSATDKFKVKFKPKEQ